MPVAAHRKMEEKGDREKREENNFYVISMVVVVVAVFATVKTCSFFYHLGSDSV